MVKDRKELATFDLGKLKAFFDRDTAMVWPETVTAERAEAGRVQRVLVTQWSHVTCYPPTSLIYSTTGPPPATTASRAVHTLW